MVPLGFGSPPGVAALPQDALRARFRPGSGRSCSARRQTAPQEPHPAARGARADPVRRARCWSSPAIPTPHEPHLAARAPSWGSRMTCGCSAGSSDEELEGLYAAAAASCSPRSTRASGCRSSRRWPGECRSPARPGRARGGQRRRGAALRPRVRRRRSARRSSACSATRPWPSACRGGRKRAAQFSWRAAAGTLASYERTLQRGDQLMPVDPEHDLE